MLETHKLTQKLSKKKSVQCVMEGLKRVIGWSYAEIPNLEILKT